MKEQKLRYLIDDYRCIIDDCLIDDLYDRLRLVPTTDDKAKEIVEWAKKANDGDIYVCIDCKVIAVCEVE